MFNTASYLFQNTTERSNRYGEEYRVSAAARRLYQRVRQQGRLSQMTASLAGRKAGRLLDLDAYTAGRSIVSRHYAGLQTVRLSQIRGSQGRCNDFDAAFHPVKEDTAQRWLRVATARQEGRGLPPVQLIQIGDLYFLQDGHHRVSVARARGEGEIEAEVKRWELA